MPKLSTIRNVQFTALNRFAVIAMAQYDTVSAMPIDLQDAYNELEDVARLYDQSVEEDAPFGPLLKFPRIVR